jgi:ribosomal protein L40E
LGDVLKDKYGFSLKVDGKTGKRTIRLTHSIVYLNAWLEVHPFKDNLDQPLFVSLSQNFGSALGYSTVTTMFRKWAENAKITKKINPHSMRHLRCTELAIMGFTVRELELHFGWKPGSQMPQRYNHQDYKHVEKKLLDRSNMTTEGFFDADKVLDRVICPKCGAEVLAENDTCPKCGQLIKMRFESEEEIQKRNVKDVLDTALNNPKYKDRMISLLKEVINSKEEATA